MSVDRVDRILRQGVGPELAELYEGIAELRDVYHRGSSRAAIVRQAGEVVKKYMRCEAAFADSELAINDFKADTNDNPNPERSVSDSGPPAQNRRAGLLCDNKPSNEPDK